MKKTKQQQRDRRHSRVRSKVSGTATVPRFSVFKSNRYVSAQLIDDEKGVTLAFATDKNQTGKNGQEKGEKVGQIIAAEALKKKINKVVFDRGGFPYVGRIKAVAEGARSKGLEF